MPDGDGPGLAPRGGLRGRRGRSRSASSPTLHSPARADAPLALIAEGCQGAHDSLRPRLRPTRAARAARGLLPHRQAGFRPSSWAASRLQQDAHADGERWSPQPQAQCSCGWPGRRGRGPPCACAARSATSAGGRPLPHRSITRQYRDRPAWRAGAPRARAQRSAAQALDEMTDRYPAQLSGRPVSARGRCPGAGQSRGHPADGRARWRIDHCARSYSAS